MSVVARMELPRFLQVGRDETIRQPLSRPDGSNVTVEAATYTLYDSDGEAVFTEPDAFASGALQLTLVDLDVEAPQDPWREKWVVTVDGEDADYTFENEVYVCRVAPAQHISVSNLCELHPQWRYQLEQARPDRAAEVLDVAWRWMIRRLLADGHLPHRVLNFWALAEVHLYRAAMVVCRDFMTDAPDASRWERLSHEYKAQSEEEYEQRTRLQKDDDEDGIADNPGQQAPAAPGPAASRWRWGHA